MLRVARSLTFDVDQDPLFSVGDYDLHVGFYHADPAKHAALVEQNKSPVTVGVVRGGDRVIAFASSVQAWTHPLHRGCGLGGLLMAELQILRSRSGPLEIMTLDGRKIAMSPGAEPLVDKLTDDGRRVLYRSYEILRQRGLV